MGYKNFTQSRNPLGRTLLIKRSQVTLLMLVFLLSCRYRPYAEEKYVIEDNYRSLINAYSPGDTLIFKSSQNIIDSFVIAGIDSAILDTDGLIMNPRLSKSISITYRQIPVDKWQFRWLEGRGDGKLHEHSEDGTFISIVKYPDTGETAYYYNFKNFRCSKSEPLRLYRDTILIDGLEIADYYKIEDSTSSSDPDAISVCYSTNKKGLVAFITNDSNRWTRQN